MDLEIFLFHYLGFEDRIQLELEFLFQAIASTTINVFDSLLKLQLKAHLLPEN